MDEAGDEPLDCERVAGTGIGKAQVMVTIRVPGDTRRGGRRQETREYRAVRKDLLEPADRPRVRQVAKVGMEAPGVTGSRCTFCPDARASTASSATPRRSRHCPAAPGPASATRPGWPGSPSAARCPPASCRRRTSAGCAPAPATAAAWSRPAPPRRPAARSCRKTRSKLSSVISGLHGVAGREMLTAIPARSLCGCPRPAAPARTYAVTGRTGISTSGSGLR
jgi:hypothetical protein